MAEVTQGFGGQKIKQMGLQIPGMIEGIILLRPDGTRLLLPVTALQLRMTAKQNVVPVETMQGGVVDYISTTEPRLELDLQALVSGDPQVFEKLVARPTKVNIVASWTERRLVVLDE